MLRRLARRLLMAAQRIVQRLFAETLSASIEYDLPAGGGRVSIVIFRSDGRVVKELKHAEQQEGGHHSEPWADVPEHGSYRWKLLCVPGGGLKAKYLMSLGSTITRGAKWWQAGLGNHVGPRCVAVEPPGPDLEARALLYAGAGSSENAPNAVCMRTPTASQAAGVLWENVWMAPPPCEAEATSDGRGKYLGRWSLAVLGNKLYHLQQNGWVGYHDKQTNIPTFLPDTEQTVGGTDKAVAGSGRWDALSGIDGRPGIRPFTSWGLEQPMDMTAGMVAGPSGVRRPMVVVSYQDLNLVRWLDPAGGPVTDPRGTRSALELYRVEVKQPKGVAVDWDGHILLISDGQVLRARVTDGGVHRERIPIIEFFPPQSPYRLDVDLHNGDILVAEAGTSHRVIRYNRTSREAVFYPRNRDGSGRKYDYRYDPKYFRDIVDICSDHQGGFWVVEGSAPRRIAHVIGDMRGLLDTYRVEEMYGGAYWVPSASPVPGDPTTVWMTVSEDELLRLKLNYDDTRRPYEVLSVHRFTDGGSTLDAGVSKCDGDRGDVIDTNTGAQRVLPFKSPTAMNGFIRSWDVRKSDDGTKTFLVRRHHVQVFQVESSGTGLNEVVRLRQVSVALLNRTASAVVDGQPMGCFTPFTWNPSPASGAGQYTLSRVWGIDNYHLQSLQSPAGFDYYHLALGNDGPAMADSPQVLRLRLKSLTVGGLPLYELGPLPGRQPSEWWKGFSVQFTDFSRASYYEEPKSIFAQYKPGEPLYVMINDTKLPRDFNAKNNRMYKLNADGTVAWAVGLHEDRPSDSMGRPPQRGHVYTMAANVGLVRRAGKDETGAIRPRDVVVATDFDGGWDGAHTAITYAWDEDGLYVGGLFEEANCDTVTPGMSEVLYIHSSDNRSGVMCDDTKVPRAVLYFAGAENEVRVYRITGWDDSHSWYRTSSTITI